MQKHISKIVDNTSHQTLYETTNNFRIFKKLYLFQIAIANNCSSFTEMAQKFRQEYKNENSKSDNEAERVFKNVLNAFEHLKEER